MKNQQPIRNAAETPETNSKPLKPICELFEYNMNRAAVWCAGCGRHIQLHKAAEPITEAEQPFSDDLLRCADQDTFNAIYRGGNSSPFPDENRY